MNRRELDLTDLDAVVLDARRLHEAGYDKAGQWNLSQICRHIAAPIDRCIDGFTNKQPLFVRLMGRYVMKGPFFKNRRVKPGLPAPANLVFERGGDEAEAVTKLEMAVSRLKAHRGDFHKHPIFGPLSTDQWHEFHTIHAMHHLSFLVPCQRANALAR